MKKNLRFYITLYLAKLARLALKIIRRDIKRILELPMIEEKMLR